jgi:hypothetical protein
MCRVEGFSGACGETTMHDAQSIDSPPDADDDGDRIVNKDDNCPTTPNPGQANEDGDARGDACDPCPVDGAPGMDNDSDGDGVGDGCDPEPGMRNRIDVFEGFNGAGPPPGAMVTGAWSYSGGQARSSPSSMPASFSWPEATTDAEMVSAHFTIASFDGAGGIQFIGVAHMIGSTSPVRCSLTPNPGSLELMSGTGQYGSSPTPVNVNTTAVTFSTRTAGAAIAPSTGGNFVCAEAVTGTTVDSYIAPDGSISGQTGFYSMGISATLDWIVIVSRAP